MKKTLMLAMVLLHAALTMNVMGQTTCEDGTRYWEEVDGMVVIEAEDATDIPDGWGITNLFPELALGTGHLVDNYPKNTPKSESAITYLIKINSPGTYRFNWRARNGVGAPESDKKNDSWVKIKADKYFGKKKKKDGTLGDDLDFGSKYVKFYVHSLSSWSWKKPRGEFHNASGNKVTGLLMFATFNDPGFYTISIAARSKDHVIDRIALYKEDKESTVTNIATPATEFQTCAGDTGSGDGGGEGNLGGGITDINSDEVGQRLKVYPNPSQGKDILIEIAEPGKHSVIITDLLSKEVYRGNFSGTVFTMSTAGLKSGIYNMVVSSDDSNLYRRILITD